MASFRYDTPSNEVRPILAVPVGGVVYGLALPAGQIGIDGSLRHGVFNSDGEFEVRGVLTFDVSRDLVPKQSDEGRILAGIRTTLTKVNPSGSISFFGTNLDSDKIKNPPYATYIEGNTIKIYTISFLENAVGQSDKDDIYVLEFDIDRFGRQSFMRLVGGRMEEIPGSFDRAEFNGVTEESMDEGSIAVIRDGKALLFLHHFAQVNPSLPSAYAVTALKLQEDPTFFQSFSAGRSIFIYSSSADVTGWKPFFGDGDRIMYYFEENTAPESYDLVRIDFSIGGGKSNEVSRLKNIIFKSLDSTNSSSLSSDITSVLGPYVLSGDINGFGFAYDKINQVIIAVPYARSRFFTYNIFEGFSPHYVPNGTAAFCISFNPFKPRIDIFTSSYSSDDGVIRPVGTGSDIVRPYYMLFNESFDRFYFYSPIIEGRADAGVNLQSVEYAVLNNAVVTDAVTNQVVSPDEYKIQTIYRNDENNWITWDVKADIVEDVIAPQLDQRSDIVVDERARDREGLLIYTEGFGEKAADGERSPRFTTKSLYEDSRTIGEPDNYYLGVPAPGHDADGIVFSAESQLQVSEGQKEIDVNFPFNDNAAANSRMFSITNRFLVSNGNLITPRLDFVPVPSNGNDITDITTSRFAYSAGRPIPEGVGALNTVDNFFIGEITYYDIGGDTSPSNAKNFGDKVYRFYGIARSSIYEILYTERRDGSKSVITNKISYEAPSGISSSIRSFISIMSDPENGRLLLLAELTELYGRAIIAVDIGGSNRASVIFDNDIIRPQWPTSDFVPIAENTGEASYSGVQNIAISKINPNLRYFYLSAGSGAIVRLSEGASDGDPRRFRYHYERVAASNEFFAPSRDHSTSLYLTTDASAVASTTSSINKMWFDEEANKLYFIDVGNVYYEFFQRRDNPQRRVFYSPILRVLSTNDFTTRDFSLEKPELIFNLPKTTQTIIAETRFNSNGNLDDPSWTGVNVDRGSLSNTLAQRYPPAADAFVNYSFNSMEMLDDDNRLYITFHAESTSQVGEEGYNYSFVWRLDPSTGVMEEYFDTSNHLRTDASGTIGISTIESSTIVNLPITGRGESDPIHVRYAFELSDSTDVNAETLTLPASEESFSIPSFENGQSIRFVIPDDGSNPNGLNERVVGANSSYDTVHFLVLVSTSGDDGTYYLADKIPSPYTSQQATYEFSSNPIDTNKLSEIELFVPVASELTNVAFRYSYVDYLGQEGPLSEASENIDLASGSVVTFKNLDVVPSAYWEIDLRKIRIYRSDGSIDYTFFAETDIVNGEPEKTEFTFNVDDVGELAESSDWYPPPENMHSIISTTNGVIVGFSENTIVPSLPYLPYAYPHDQRISITDNIIGGAAVNDGIIVLTDRNPRVIYGQEPSSYSEVIIGKNEGCVSQRSIVNMTNHVRYASPNGIIAVSTDRQITNITEPLFSIEQWKALQPETIQAWYWNDSYVFFYGVPDSDGIHHGYILTSGSTPSLSKLTAKGHVTAGFYERETGNLYLSISDVIYKFNDPESGVIGFKWESKTYHLPRPVSIGAMQLIAERAYPGGNPCVRFNLYAKNKNDEFVPLYENGKYISGSEETRIKTGGFKYNEFKFTLESDNAIVKGISLAEDLVDLSGETS